MALQKMISVKNEGAQLLEQAMQINKENLSGTRYCR